MKNIFKLTIIFTSILFGIKANAQLDTLNYLKQFEANKAQYINKPLSYLLSQMNQIQPKTIWPIPVTNKKSIIRESAFNFSEKKYNFHNTIEFYITWQEEIPYSQVDYYQKKNGFYFTNEEKAFYGSKIVKDIMVYR